MTRPGPIPPTLQRVLLLALGVVAVYAALIPLGPGSGLVPPNLLYCLVFAWTVRSPAAVSAPLVLVLGLFADVMLTRPIGLGALGLVLAAEAVRGRTALFRGAPFVLEWLAAVAGFGLVLAASDLVLRLALVRGPGLGPLLAHVVATAIAYPVVVAGLVLGLGLRPPAAVRVRQPR